MVLFLALRSILRRWRNRFGVFAFLREVDLDDLPALLQQVEHLSGVDAVEFGGVVVED